MGKFYLLFFTCLLFINGLRAQGIAPRTEAKIDQVYAQYALSGKGVLTIMMDRGIDYRHPDFLDSNGKTRIAYIYDLYDDSGANDADNPFGVGTIYDSSEINAALQIGGEPITNDIFGHGTATTGIMCGNGNAVAPAETFRGVAYQSKIISIIVTKNYVPPFGDEPGQQGAYNPGLLPYAFQFAEQKIAELDMPSVTLLNIGSIQNPTDGSTEICSYIDAFVENGNTFVCGVGDDGGKDNHMIETLIEDQSSEFVIQKGGNGNLRFMAWYHEDDRFEFSLQRPNGDIEGPFSPPNSASDVKDNFLNQINIYHRGADVEFSNSSADWRLLMIDFLGENGTYIIDITPTDIQSNGRIHGFLNPARFSDNNSFLNNVNPGGNINSFSACKASISPGDYVATNKWTDINGINRVKNNQGEPGELWKGSSVGPTIDGRLGIDLVAPGEIASAAYGEGSYYSNFQFNLLNNGAGYYGIQTAVSAAAPITAGVIALMLEVNPELSPEEIKSILQESAKSDNFTGITPNEEYGYGKLDALEAIQQTYETVGLKKEPTKNSTFSIYPNPADQYTIISLHEPFHQDQILSVHTLEGIKIKDFKISADGRLDIHELPNGVYILQMNNGVSAIAKLLFKK